MATIRTPIATLPTKRTRSNSETSDSGEISSSKRRSVSTSPSDAKPAAPEVIMAKEIEVDPSLRVTMLTPKTQPQEQNSSHNTTPPSSKLMSPSEANPSPEVTMAKEMEVDPSPRVTVLPPKTQPQEQNSAKKTTPSSSKCEKRKSKRRSTFLRGRVSKVVSPIITEVSLEIDETLPVDERLAHLTNAAAIHAVKKLRDECEDLDDFQQFSIIVREPVAETVSKLVKEDIFKAATSENSYLVNPYNELATQEIERLSSYTEMLRREFEHWQELLSHRTDLTEQAQSKLREMEDNPVREQPAVRFSSQEQSLLSGRLNLNQLLTGLSQSREQTVLSVHRLQDTVATLQRFEQTASSTLADCAAHIHSKTFEEALQDFKDPKQLIASALE